MNEFLEPSIFEYVDSHSDSESKILKELYRETHLNILNTRMLCSRYQGRVLSLISKILQPKKVLEIGTYTGYSAICFAEGLSKNGLIHTIDINEELIAIQNKFFEKSGFRKNIKQHTGNALKIIPTLKDKFDLVYLDADKENYIKYFNLIIDKIIPGGLLLSDNVLWSGKVVEKTNGDFITNELIEFNKMLKNDSRVNTVILPIRDGLTISRKN